METALSNLSTHDEALHNMAMDDVAELVPPGEEHRVPERVRSEVTQRHAVAAAKRPYQKWELTPEREAIIRARYDGKTSTIRAIADDIQVPWYTVRDWAQGRLQLRNPDDAQPNGPGRLAQRDKPKAVTSAPAHADGEEAKPKAKGKIPWSTAPDEQEQSEIEAAREKRNAMTAAASPDDVIRADTTTGWLTPKWGDYTDEIGALISAQWDGADTSLVQLAERARFPLGVLRGWIAEHHLTPKAAPAKPAPLPLPVTPLPPKSAQNANRHDARLERFTAWLDGEVGGDLSVFLLPAQAEVMVLRSIGGYRVLTPRGDWPDEPISRALIERIVRLLSGGASDASVYGAVYRAEGASV